MNAWDAITNCMFVAEIAFSFLGIQSRVLSSLKVFRMVRIFKLAGQFQGFRSLVGKMLSAVSAVYSMLIALAILVFFVSVALMHLFANMYDDMYGGRCLTSGFQDAMTASSINATLAYATLHTPACALKPRHHFDNIAISYVTVFQVITTENWLTVMWDTYQGTGPLSFILFPLIIVVGNYVTMNIFLAILLSTFAQASKIEALAADKAAEKEEEEFVAASQAAAAVTANAELMLRGDQLSQSFKRQSRARSPTKREKGSPLGQRASGRSGSPKSGRSGSPSSAVGEESFQRRLTLREQAKGTSPNRKRGAISMATSPPGEGGGGSATAAAAAAALGPDATLRATKIFLSHDHDGSGSIDINELSLALKELGLEAGSEHVVAIIDRYDRDRSNTLELPEFLALVRDTPAAPPTAAGRFFHSMLPPSVKEATWMKDWVKNAAARAAAVDQQKAAARAFKERARRRQARSLMRQRTSKYGTLNAWEVAYFRGAFSQADIDGDGYLVLDEVYALLIQLDEEPQSNDTWDVLDANAARDDLISKDEFLTFISIKRTDEAANEAKGQVGQERAKAAQAGNDARRARIRARQKRTQSRFGVWMRRISRVIRLGRRVYLDRLPPLGEFAREGLGEERARLLQRLIYSRAFWTIEVFVIIASAVLVTSEIDVMVRTMRLNAGATSLSADAIAPRYMVAIFDSAFMGIAFLQFSTKLFVEGFRDTLRQPWNVLDFCAATFSVLRLVVGADWRRTLLSFSSLRVFMLLSRFKELKLLSESILRALPNVMVTMASLMIDRLLCLLLSVSRPIFATK